MENLIFHPPGKTCTLRRPLALTSKLIQAPISAAEIKQDEAIFQKKLQKGQTIEQEENFYQTLTGNEQDEGFYQALPGQQQEEKFYQALPGQEQDEGFYQQSRRRQEQRQQRQKQKGQKRSALL